MTARILEITPHEYHRLPHFSSSRAKMLVTQCASKAWDAHQRKIEAIEAEDESDDEGVTDEKRKRLEVGTILHALVLGRGGERLVIVPQAILGKGDAYNTKEAKAARDGARAAGLVPVKEPEMPVFLHIASAITERLAAAGHELTGTSELAIEWTENTPHGPVLCKGMLDHVELWGDPPTTAIVSDLKIVGDANPDRCERTAESLCYGIPACAYTRGLNAVYPSLQGRIGFQFLFCEQRRPFEFWDPPQLSGPFRELGERRWLRAVHAWAEGLATNRWPGYRTPDRVQLSAPMWTLKQEGYTPEDM